MEPDEIGVVLARASELHAKITDAIERALKSEFLLSTSGGRSPKNGDSAAAVSAGDNASGGSPTSDSGRGGGKESSSRRTSESDGSHEQRGDGSAEARSLGAIRDALEVLEEQLEALQQTVQQQQRTEKDAALAELEESRRILLRRLKDHRGREWEVVHEALAFAGEPVDDRDDLPLPPYPMPLSDSSFVLSREGQSAPYNGAAAQKYNGSMKQVYFGPGEVEGEEHVPYTEEAEGNEEGNEEEGTSFQGERGRKEGGGFLGFAKAFLGFAYGVTSKVAIVAVSVAAALAVSEVTRRLESRKSFSNGTPSRPPAPPPPATARQLPPRRECPPGKKLIMEDGFPKCVVKERIEVPFYKEVKTPDVLYGRG
ncbi:unnamed protein product [Calypogeia fissa]